MKAAKPKSLKKSNRKTVLGFFRNSGAVTVNKIYKAIGLSKTTIMKVVLHYVELGIVEEAGKGDSTDEGGKKPLLYRLREKHGFAIGVQIFPDSIYLLAVDLRLTPLEHRLIGFDDDRSSETVIRLIGEGIESIITEKGLSRERCIGIGVGTHGITDYDTGTVLVSPHFPDWGKDLPFRSLLKQKIGLETPLFVDNQIRFQAFAEQTVGIARDKKNIVVIEGGSGLVAGIIVKDEIKRGVHYLAGEIGHMVINPGDTEQCRCGGYGCFEMQVSVKRLLQRAEENRLRFAGPDKTSQIFQLADQGNAAARKTLDETVYWFALGLSNVMLMHDPEVIILHGTYSQAGNYFLSRLREETNSVVIRNLDKNIEIRYSELVEERGSIGAAAFAVEKFFTEEALYTTG